MSDGTSDRGWLIADSPGFLARLALFAVRHEVALGVFAVCLTLLALLTLQ